MKFIAKPVFKYNASFPREAITKAAFLGDSSN